MGIQHIENRKSFTGISPLNVYNYIYKFYIYEKNHLIKIISSLMVKWTLMSKPRTTPSKVYKYAISEDYQFCYKNMTLQTGASLRIL